jgi:hypothetical protein
MATPFHTPMFKITNPNDEISSSYCKLFNFLCSFLQSTYRWAWTSSGSFRFCSHRFSFVGWFRRCPRCRWWRCSSSPCRRSRCLTPIDRPRGERPPTWASRKSPRREVAASVVGSECGTTSPETISMTAGGLALWSVGQGKLISRKGKVTIKSHNDFSICGCCTDGRLPYLLQLTPMRLSTNVPF